MKKRKLLVVLLIAFSSSSALAQTANGIFDSSEEYGQFMGAAKRASVDNPELQVLIPLINDIAQGRPIGSTAQQYGVAGSELGLLSDPRIRADIEMVDDQYHQLRDRQSEIQKRLAGQLRAIDFSDSENVAGEIAKIRADAEKEMNDVLLPHQVKRLRQIRMQSLLRRRSLVDVLTSNPIKADLEITDSQSEELREYEQEVQRDLRREIAKLQEKSRDRLLARLKPSQKAQARELIGDAYVFTEPAAGKSTAEKARRFKGKPGGQGK